MTSLIQRDKQSALQSIRPMLAQAVRRLPEGPQWAYEFKWDGIRALAFIHDGDIRLLSRNGSDLTTRFPELHGLADQRLGESLVLDGEIIAMHNDRADFGRLQPRIHLSQPDRIARLAKASPTTYMIFDVLEHDGQSWVDAPLTERRAQLEHLDLNGLHWHVPPILPGDEGAASQVIEVARRHGLEGVIAKRWDSAYEPGRRSGAWVKYKIVLAQEFVIGGWRPSQSGRKEIGALAVGYHPSAGNPTLHFAGFVGSGFKQRDHQHLLEGLNRRRQPDNPFDSPLPKQDVRFVRPELVVHVRFSQWTDQGILRHPSYKGLRIDKPAREVIREL